MFIATSMVEGVLAARVGELCLTYTYNCSFSSRGFSICPYITSEYESKGSNSPIQNAIIRKTAITETTYVLCAFTRWAMRFKNICVRLLFSMIKRARITNDRINEEFLVDTPELYSIPHPKIATLDSRTQTVII